ncbi:hypothetical protein BaRGS_00019228 [Batillaria attramentaria]|uniref:Uncharacterized protein n=1 Tax=Batillaria attramentaria TaxID=370345 RepID=A0ABD0KRT7_9CAEN
MWISHHSFTNRLHMASAIYGRISVHCVASGLTPTVSHIFAIPSLGEVLQAKQLQCRQKSSSTPEVLKFIKQRPHVLSVHSLLISCNRLALRPLLSRQISKDPRWLSGA